MGGDGRDARGAALKRAALKSAPRTADNGEWDAPPPGGGAPFPPVRPPAAPAARPMVPPCRRPAPASRSARVCVTAVGVVGVAMALQWAWWLATDGGAQGRATALALLPLALAMTAVVALAPRTAHLDRPLRPVWRRLTVGLLAWAASAVIWELSGRAALSWADPVQMLFFPLVVWGVLGVPATPMARADRLRFALDAGVVVLSGAAGVWFFVVWPSLGHGPTHPLGVLVNALYPVWDLVLLFAAAAALLRRAHPTARRALGWVAVGLLARFAGDLAFGRDTASGQYQPGGASDLWWLTSVWLLAVAAVVQRRDAERAVHHGAARGTAAGPAADAAGGAEPAFSLLPYLSVAVVYLFLLTAARAAWGPRLYGVLVAAVCVTGLVLVRQFLATRDNVRLHRAHAAREAVRAGEARFRALVQHSLDLVAVVDPTGRITYATPSFERVIGVAPDALTGRSLVELLHPDDVPYAQRALAEAGAAPGQTVGPTLLRARRVDGSWREMECLRTDLLHEPAVRGIVVTARDVTVHVALQRQLAHQAFHDALTGLANRALFRDRVEHALSLAARRGASVAVLFLDLDDFKRVNDSLGHAAGDQLLVEVAARLLNATRGCDTVARLGGDEFAVLLEQTASDADATIVADRVVQTMTTPIVLDGAEVLVRASVGIARARPEDGAEELLRNADLAMYRAKQGGKGRHELFDPAMHAAVAEGLALEADLRHALADESAMDAGLRVHFQPIVDLATGVPIGAEALVRWQHPRRGLVSPSAFIPLAETSGLIVPLGAWVLRTACRQAAAWHAARVAAHGPDVRPLSLSVNLAGRQLQHPGLLDTVRGALAAAGLAARQLVLEITESELMRDTDATRATLHALKALGVRLAIDDFGTGYSSLAYLRDFPVDVLKIDKSFVDGLARGGSDAALARTIVALGETLALHTVAEGVETELQRDRLRALGCGSAQGYLLARPLPADAAGALLVAAGSPAGSPAGPALAGAPR